MVGSGRERWGEEEKNKVTCCGEWEKKTKSLVAVNTRQPSVRAEITETNIPRLLK